MRSKKKTNRFRGKLQKTMTDEKGDIEERFSRADVALGNTRDDTKRSKPNPRKKVIRDNFSMPEEDYALIDEIRKRLIREHAVVRNKSEVLRAGLLALAKMSSQEMLEASDRVKQLKPGRKPTD